MSVKAFDRQFSAILGALIRKYRFQQGLSQETLAKKAKVHPTYINMLENNKRAVGLDCAQQIAEALGLKLSELIREVESQLHEY